MTTSTMGRLFQVAIRDLWEGRELVRLHMPRIAQGASDRPTRALLIDLAKASVIEMVRLAEIVDDPKGDPNLWVQGILRDADRDINSNVAGPVRDVALIGAIRKLVAADAVSIATAILLAPDTVEQLLQNLHRDAVKRDAALKQKLASLTRSFGDFLQSTSVCPVT